jgi:hypothetical protein
MQSAMSASTVSGTALLERPPASARPPRAGLLEVTPVVRERIEPALREAGFEIHACAVIDSKLLDVDVVVIEADRGARMLSGMQALRRLTEHASLAGVISWWSEYESDLISLADAILHVPIRDNDLTAAIAAMQRQPART